MINQEDGFPIGGEDGLIDQVIGKKGVFVDLTDDFMVFDFALYLVIPFP